MGEIIQRETLFRFNIGNDVKAMAISPTKDLVIVGGRDGKEYIINYYD